MKNKEVKAIFDEAGYWWARKNPQKPWGIICVIDFGNEERSVLYASLDDYRTGWRASPDELKEKWPESEWLRIVEPDNDGRDREQPKSRIFYCVEQELTPIELGFCTISLEKNGMALIMDAQGKTLFRRVDRAQVDWMQADGFMVSGYEEVGQSKLGKPLYRKKEWFFRYQGNRTFSR